MEAIATCVDVDVPDSYLVAVAEREFQEKLLTMVGGCLLSCVFVVFLTAMPSVAPALCGRGCRRTCCGGSCLLLPVLLKIVYLPLLSAWQARSHTHTHTHTTVQTSSPPGPEQRCDPPGGGGARDRGGAYGLHRGQVSRVLSDPLSEALWLCAMCMWRQGARRGSWTLLQRSEQGVWFKY